MFSDLVGWYTGHEENRRRYPRVKKDYDAECSIDGGRRWTLLKGVDLSGGGMCVNSERELPKVLLALRMMLEGKPVKLKALEVWSTQVESIGKPAFCYGLQFTSIAGSDWETIMLVITGGAALSPEGLAAIRLNESEVANLINPVLRMRMLSELVKRQRLAPLVAKVPVRAQFDYAGVNSMNGRPMHKFTIHSVVNDGKSETRFSTRLLCGEDGTEIVVLDET